jgi:exonuclease V gamma subunit
MLDNKKWLERWEATTLLQCPSNDDMAVKAFLQRQLLKKWEEKNSTKYRYYTEKIIPNFRTQYYKEKRNIPMTNLLETVHISTLRRVASIRTGSHKLQSEIGRWI